ncbi:MAG: metallophosphoesterase [Candidatus Hydrogenedentes bacterium]|nr:metallophosphoesterase [Candidatus Hydrogenedentota bacterium]
MSPSLEHPYAVLNASGYRSVRILQLTDFHSDKGDEPAEQTYADVRAIVDHTQPSLLAVTGDIWCCDDDAERAPFVMRRDLAFVESLGVPWAFTPGNHDHPDTVAEALARSAASLGASLPLGNGDGDYRVEVQAEGVACWDIFFLNSRARSLAQEDVAWLEHESNRLQLLRGRAIPAIAYFHIPLKQYESARLDGRARGYAQEEVLYWDDDGTLFDGIRRAGNVRACFVGHSHANDFWFEEDGIVLSYGRAAGHGGYGADRLRKGATLVEIDTASARFDFVTVFADGSRWSAD